MLEFGRDICGDLVAAGRREWLVTNGIGGYASGTIAGVLTRRYHGLLLAALDPPVARTLLVTKLDETVTYAGTGYPLYANRWQGAVVEPDGFHHLERFRLEGTTPVWTYACADALLEKRVWMQPGANTTYVQYSLLRSGGPVTLRARVIVNYRDYHGNTRAGDWSMDIKPVPHGLQFTAFQGAASFYILADRARFELRPEWCKGFFLSIEEYRGLNPLDDNLCAGVFTAAMHAGESITVAASTEPAPGLDGEAAYAQRQAHEQLLIARSRTTSAPDWRRQLVLAADQFIVDRPLPGEPEGRSVIAGYPWFTDWGRDTMISLPGLTLATGRPEIAARVLRTFSRFVSQGMLPNRFPDRGEQPEYNTVDATLWYFEAIRAYHAATGDGACQAELFPVLEDIVAWHRRGTRYQIHVDPQDGLLYAGESGVQLTWMDAKVGDWVVTPRTGKAVEINALWYNALRIMAEFASRLGRSPEPYTEMADKAQGSFARFWNAGAGYCYDVVDGPDGADASLRPNQLLAVSLPHSPLGEDQQRKVVDACAGHLLTSHGLRSLAPNDPAFTGHYGGDQRTRDAAYHRGTVWAWLIGPFVSAHVRVYHDLEAARSFLQPLILHLGDHGLGSISEIFDGDAPFTPRGCFAQAWSVGELLRVLAEIESFEGD